MKMNTRPKTGGMVWVKRKRNASSKVSLNRIAKYVYIIDI